MYKTTRGEPKSVGYHLQNGGLAVEKGRNPHRLSNPEVDLSNHQLTTIPPYIYDHPRVQTLVLSRNMISEIPKAIGSLRQLRKLIMDDNQLTFIAENLCNCTKLEFLSLAKNSLSLLPANIGDLNSLTTLCVADNEFESVPYEIGMLDKLVELDVKGNQLWYLPFSVENLRRLKKLDLSNNHFEHLPMPVCHIHSLISLSIHGNQLLSLAPVFQQLQNLHELNLADNRLKKIPPPICKIQSLRYLNLGLNQISEISIEIANLIRLKVLHVPGNLLRTFPNTLSNLRYLNVAQNQIANFSVAGMKKLRYINADNNLMENVPLALYNLTNLEHLKLNNNRITFLSQDIALLKDLKTLDIGNNLLTSLPHVISELQNLDYFNVTGNDINQRFLSNRVEIKHDHTDKSWLRQKIEQHKKKPPSPNVVLKGTRYFDTDIKDIKDRHLAWSHDTSKQLRNKSITNFNEVIQEPPRSNRSPRPQMSPKLPRKKITNVDKSMEKRMAWQKKTHVKQPHDDSESSDTDFELLGVCSEIESMLTKQLFQPVFSGTETLPKNFRKKSIVKTPNGLWRLSDGDTTSTQTCDSSILFTPRKHEHSAKPHGGKQKKHSHHRSGSDPDIWVSGESENDGTRRRPTRRSRTVENLEARPDIVSATPAIHTQTDHFLVTRNGGTFMSAAEPRVKLTIPPYAVKNTHKIIMQVIKMFAETIVSAQDHLASAHNILSISDIVHLRNTSDINVNHPVRVTIPLPYRARHSHVHILTVTEDDTCVPYGGEYTESNGHATLVTWSLTGKVAVATKSKCPYKACHSVEQLLQYMRT